jgi:uncharacterized damage-inducible protein DinB
MRDLFQTHARYNAWMNEKIYARCAGISDADRKKDMGAFFKSIHGTLNHLLVADMFNRARFCGEPLPAMGLDAIVHQDFEALRTARRALDADIIDIFNGATETWLNEPMSVVSVIYKTTFNHARWFFALQFFNHQTHHRGQVTTLMMQLGVDPGITDMPGMLLPAA